MPGLHARPRRGRSRDRQLDLAVLTVNAGSTSLKLHLVEDGESRAVDAYELAEAVGHRVVHGGRRFAHPTLIDDEVIAEIEALSPLAPLHNVPALAAIGEARAALPDVPARWRLTGVDLAPDPGLDGIAWQADVPEVEGLLFSNEWLDDVPLDVVFDDRLVEVAPDGAESLGPPAPRRRSTGRAGGGPRAAGSRWG